MRRVFLRHRMPVGLAVVCVILVTAGGCRNLLTTASYLVLGTDLPAKYDGLREKKVAVVCRSAPSLDYRANGVNKELAQQVARLLKKNVHKIEIVDPRKVDEWVDENQWHEYSEIGDALGADMVVGIDLLEYSIHQDQTLYQGRALTAITVCDCAHGGEVVYQDTPPETRYPNNAGVPTADRRERQFQAEFIAVLAERLGRYFYKHDAYADFAQH